MQAGTSPRIFLVAGEPSGDEIGDRLMSALRTVAGEDVRFAGIGGKAMTARGLRTLFPIEELSVMGLVEVLLRTFSVMRRMSETAGAIRRLSPDAVVTIDAPAFANGVWRRLGGVDALLIHYVAPTVWAWRAGRGRKLAARIDHLLVLLPFEPPYFEAEGLDCTFVGHPGLETEIGTRDGEAFRASHGIGAGPTIGLLPRGGRNRARRTSAAGKKPKRPGGGSDTGCRAPEVRRQDRTGSLPMTDAADKSSYRFLHTMIRVRDLEKSLDFYTRHLGMNLLRRREFPDGRFTLAFVGYGEETDNTVIELTHNWDQEDAYDLGSAFGHLAVAVPDVYETCEALEKEGVAIPRPPGPMKFGGSQTHMAFIEDPDGYRVELIQRS